MNQKLILAFITLMSSVGYTTTIVDLVQRSEKAAQIIGPTLDQPAKDIPLLMLKKSVCIAAIPDVERTGFNSAFRSGNGMMSCRTQQGWSRPGFIYFKGNIYGSPIGTEPQQVLSTDHMAKKKPIDQLAAVWMQAQWRQLQDANYKL